MTSSSTSSSSSSSSLLLLFDEQEHCSTTMCALLPVGFVLMSMDIYHDLGWFFFPSKRTATSLRSFYKFILTPRLLPPYPGYLFPIYSAFVFLYQCPNVYSWYTLLFYLPVTYRYYRILTSRDSLQHWWIVVLMRFFLTVTTLWNFNSRGCEWSNYWNDLYAALQRQLRFGM